MCLSENMQNYNLLIGEKSCSAERRLCIELWRAEYIFYTDPSEWKYITFVPNK